MNIVWTFYSLGRGWLCLFYRRFLFRFTVTQRWIVWFCSISYELIDILVHLKGLCPISVRSLELDLYFAIFVVAFNHRHFIASNCFCLFPLLGFFPSSFGSCLQSLFAHVDVHIKVLLIWSVWIPLWEWPLKYFLWVLSTCTAWTFLRLEKFWACRLKTVRRRMNEALLFLFTRGSATLGNCWWPIFTFTALASVFWIWTALSAWILIAYSNWGGLLSHKYLLMILSNSKSQLLRSECYFLLSDAKGCINLLVSGNGGHCLEFFIHHIEIFIMILLVKVTPVKSKLNMTQLTLPDCHLTANCWNRRKSLQYWLWKSQVVRETF